MEDPDALITNLEDAELESHFDGEHYGHAWKVLTPGMRERGGKLGVGFVRLPPGRVTAPFHAHQLEDEVFYILSGRGVLRYGKRTYRLEPGDCIACPAGQGIAHQISNPDGDEDLTYLAMGPHEANEVCTYPDSGKVFTRALKTVGRLSKTAYMDGEPNRPPVFDLLDSEG